MIGEIFRKNFCACLRKQDAELIDVQVLGHPLPERYITFSRIPKPIDHMLSYFGAVGDVRSTISLRIENS